MTKKEIRDLLHFAKLNGFTLVRQTKHFVLRRNKKTVVLGRTPSCCHAINNAKSDIKRIVKEES